MSKKPVRKVGDVVQTEHGPAIVTKIWPSGMLSITTFPADRHPVWGLILDPRDTK